MYMKQQQQKYVDAHNMADNYSSNGLVAG